MRKKMLLWPLLQRCAPSGWHVTNEETFFVIITAVTTGLPPSSLRYPSPELGANHGFKQFIIMDGGDSLALLISRLVAMRLVAVSFPPVPFSEQVWSKFTVEQEIWSLVLPFQKQLKLFLFPPQSRPVRCLFGTTSLPSEWRSSWSGNPSGLLWRGYTFFSVTCHLSTPLGLSSIVSPMYPPSFFFSFFYIVHWGVALYWTLHYCMLLLWPLVPFSPWPPRSSPAFAQDSPRVIAPMQTQQAFILLT